MACSLSARDAIFVLNKWAGLPVGASGESQKGLLDWASRSAIALPSWEGFLL
jgi:hypothetical protein